MPCDLPIIHQDLGQCLHLPSGWSDQEEMTEVALARFQGQPLIVWKLQLLASCSTEQVQAPLVEKETTERSQRCQRCEWRKWSWETSSGAPSEDPVLAATAIAMREPCQAPELWEVMLNCVSLVKFGSACYAAVENQNTVLLGVS